jgi:CheY-like chemotaxis protein
MKGDADTLLTGKHVLLVEDQTLIALDTESLLRELGAAAVETFTNAEAVLAWLASASPDVAVLDINRGGSSSFSVAEALQQRGAPFVFTTGYSEGFDVPETYRPVPVARKPYTRESLAQVLEDCLAERRAAGTYLPGNV